MLKSKLIMCILIVIIFLSIICMEKEVFLVMPKSELLEVALLPIIEVERVDKMVPLKYTSHEFEAGMNILIYGHPDLNEVRDTFEDLRNLGINSVSLNFPLYQSDWQANQVTTSPEYTPTVEELYDVIVIAQEYDLGVMIRPILDEQVFMADGLWRGQIKPSDPDSWFDSYQSIIITYAQLAESSQAESLNIGTEFNSMQSRYQDRWIELIESVRQVYHGKLLYSFNYDTVLEIPSLEFVKHLDQVGIDAYFPLNVPDHASVDMLTEEWHRQIAQLKEALSDYPIVITEVGILPYEGVYRTPYVWSFPNGNYDPQTQAIYYEATYNVWKPLVEGIYWWVVTLGQDPNETSFSPLNLPTEDVLKKYFLKYSKVIE